MKKLNAYAVLVRKWGVYLKDWEFFVKQGGLVAEWGREWLTVHAENEEEARAEGERLRKIEYET